MSITRDFNFFSSLSNLFSSDSFPLTPEQFEDSSTLEETIANAAVVEKAIQPGKPGRVKYQGVWWSARCLENITLLPEQTVTVVGRMNLTLLVQPTPQQA
ncbi:NfeD family protein [Cyanobacteria bacterium FACHB-502]|nr:NfeD family protein [Cyanobacteria bacterium FACHB-502]